MAGVVWSPAFGDFGKLKDALECTSFLATTVAAVVAIYALNAWKAQFRHAERFTTLKSLKDTATDLHLYRGYLLAIIAVGESMRARDEARVGALQEVAMQKREKLLGAFSAYNKSWASAVPFFTVEEESKFPGAPDKFISLFLVRPAQIYEACERYIESGQEDIYQGFLKEIDDEAKELYASTVRDIEVMLRRKV
jgi:hypothetical protein